MATTDNNNDNDGNTTQALLPTLNKNYVLLRQVP